MTAVTNAGPSPARRACLRAGLGAGFALMSSPMVASTDDRWRERVLQGLGTTIWLRAAADSRVRAERGLDAAVAAIHRVERSMSLFDPGSQLCRLNREGELADPDPWLLDVMTLALAVAAASDGAFDPTVQPLWTLWDAARRAGTRPSTAGIAAARARVDWRAVDVGTRTIRFTRAGTAVTLNGIAQGFAADVARDALQEAGVADALIDAGEWSSLGRAPAGEPWALALADPVDPGRIAGLVRPDDGRSIATSSGFAYPFTADRSAHHILDPHTGVSPPGTRLVSILAPRCAFADALTKVFYMAPIDRHPALLTRWRGDTSPAAGERHIDVISIDAGGVIRSSSGSLLNSTVPARRPAR